MSAKAAAPAVVRNFIKESASMRTALSLAASLLLGTPAPVTLQANQPFGMNTMSAPNPAANPAFRPPTNTAIKLANNPTNN